MSYIANDWVKIEPSSGSGNTSVLATILNVNFGRTVVRRVSIVGTTTHGNTASATITQQARGPYIEIDHIEDGNGIDITDYPTPNTVASRNDVFTIVGYANLNYLVIEETSAKDYTSINDETDPHHPYNFTLTDSSSQTHTEPLDDEFTQDYGANDRYMFEIEFELHNNESSSQRTISIMVSDGGSLERAVNDEITFYQEGS